MNHVKARELSDQMLIFYRLYNEKVSRKFRKLHGDEVSPAQYLLMGIIAEAGRITVGDLSERAMMPKQQVTRALNQLEDKGYVLRRHLPDNRRLVWLECTPRAEVLQQEMVRETQSQLSDIFERLDEQDMEDYLSAMQTVNRILEKFPVG